MAVEMKDLVPSGILLAAVDEDTRQPCYTERMGFLIGDRVTIHRESCPLHGSHWYVALLGIIAYPADSLKEALAKANYLETMIELDQIHGAFKRQELANGAVFWEPKLDEATSNILNFGMLIDGETDPEF